LTNGTPVPHPPTMAPKRARSTRTADPATPALQEDPATPATAMLAPSPGVPPCLPLLPPPAINTPGMKKEDLSSLECPVCYSYMQPPFLQCGNAHSICNECCKAGDLTSCPICRVSIEEEGSLAPSSKLATLAATVEAPCSNGCGARLAYLSLRDHERLECPLAPRTCPIRAGFAFDAKGWSASRTCDCRGLDVADPKALSEHLVSEHGIAKQQRDEERSSTWTLKLPAAELFETGLFASAEGGWGQPATHRCAARGLRQPVRVRPSSRYGGAWSSLTLTKSLAALPRQVGA
jgi:hypothetical protein